MPSTIGVQSGPARAIAAIALALLPLTAALAANDGAPTPVAPAVLYEQTRAALRSSDPQDRLQGLVHFLRAAEAAEKNAPAAERSKVASELVGPMKAEILHAAGDGEPGVDLAAARLCRYLPADKDVVAALSKLATNRYRAVRYAALGSLADIADGSAAAHAFALELLRSDDHTRFASGAYLAGRWEMIDAVPLLIVPLDQGDLIEIRASAAALGRIGHNAENALPALRKAIRTIDAMMVTPPRPAVGEDYREGEAPVDLAEARLAVKDAIHQIESAPPLH